MSTYLQICQMAARESGTISGTQPTTTVSQTGRLLKFVNWVDIAYRQIQTMRRWLWMRAEFSAEASASTTRYTPASFSLTRLSQWITESDSMTCYLTATGVSDEQVMAYMPWKTWRRTYERGTQTEARPTHFTVSPANELCIGPVPDAAYTIRGEYWKNPDTLSGDADIPELPTQFHDLIAWKALILMQEHDEAQLNIAIANRRYRELLSDMMREQLPVQMVAAGPLA